VDAWFESMVLAMAVIAVGVAALGPRYELWQANPATAIAMRCVPLHGAAADHQPRCATAVSIEAAAPLALQRLARD